MPAALAPIAHLLGRPGNVGPKSTSGGFSPGAAALCLDLVARRPDDPGIEDPTKLLSYDDALAVIARLVDVARARGETLRSPIVLVGGTALAGWQIRAYSRDVDIYMPEISADAVEIVEQELRATYGTSFRLDVTTGENVWGAILVRDIASSPALGTIAGLELRALRIEDLFLLKLASGRTRDLDDLDLIAPRTTPGALLDRWNQLIKWHGDRHAILGFADALVLQLQKQFDCEPLAMIARLEITAGQRALLLDTYHGKESE
jgi:predicted nucleotidyltransferase